MLRFLPQERMRHFLSAPASVRARKSHHNSAGMYWAQA
jgi:hypothetical protein